MEFHLLPVFAFLCLALEVSHASLPSEVYWQTMLRNTPMPKAIRDLLDFLSELLSSICFRIQIELLALVVSHASLPSEVYWQTVLPNTLMPKAIRDILPRPGKSTSIEFSKEDWSPDRYANYYSLKTSTGGRLQDDQNVTNFFLEKDLHPGAKMNLPFTKFKDGVTFLSREVAESIPFSSNKFPEILNRFSVKPKSKEAQIMKETIELCEGSENEGEDKLCATSLESLIDFTTSKLGKKVQALSTEVDTTGTQEYKIGVGMKMVGDEPLACHKKNYAYAVFYCHAIPARTYIVPLVDAKGMKSKAVAICHTDTLSWNPKFYAFQMLKVKPGTLSICHFLPNDNVVWVSN